VLLEARNGAALKRGSAIWCTFGAAGGGGQRIGISQQPCKVKRLY
jgi:hypothetical protein